MSFCYHWYLNICFITKNSWLVYILVLTIGCRAKANKTISPRYTEDKMLNRLGSMTDCWEEVGTADAWLNRSGFTVYSKNGFLLIETYLVDIRQHSWQKTACLFSSMHSENGTNCLYWLRQCQDSAISNGESIAKALPGEERGALNSPNSH